jgi:hypothetical protein
MTSVLVYVSTLPIKISIGWKDFLKSNTLAYYTKMYLTVKLLYNCWQGGSLLGRSPYWTQPNANSTYLAHK